MNAQITPKNIQVTAKKNRTGKIVKPNQSKHLSKVNQIAVGYKKKLGVSHKIAMKLAWKEYKEGFTPIKKIEFTKANGEQTTRIATKFNLKVNKKGGYYLQFWSLTNDAWKCAVIDRIESIEPCHIMLNNSN